MDLLAQSSGGDFGQFGIIGGAMAATAVAVAGAMQRWVLKPAQERETKAQDRATAAEEARVSDLKEVVPVLERVVTVLDRLDKSGARSRAPR